MILPPPSDRIFLRGYVTEAEIGVNPEEYGVRQRLRFDVTVEVPRVPVTCPDRIGCVVSYAGLVVMIEAALAGPRMQLVETLAGRIFSRLFFETGALAAEISIEKLDRFPPAVVGITLCRRREDFLPG